MAKKSKVRVQFEAMERCMRGFRQPAYKGLNFSLGNPDNRAKGSLYLYFVQDYEVVVEFEFYTQGRILKCIRVSDSLNPSQAKLSQRVYKTFEKFYKVFIEFGGKA